MATNQNPPCLHFIMRQLLWGSESVALPLGKTCTTTNPVKSPPCGVWCFGGASSWHRSSDGVNLVQFLDRHVRSDATTPECYISGPIYCFQQEHAGAGKTQGVRRTLRDLLKPRVPLLRVVRHWSVWGSVLFLMVKCFFCGFTCLFLVVYRCHTPLATSTSTRGSHCNFVIIRHFMVKENKIPCFTPSPMVIKRCFPEYLEVQAMLVTCYIWPWSMVI